MDGAVSGQGEAKERPRRGRLYGLGVEELGAVVVHDVLHVLLAAPRHLARPLDCLRAPAAGTKSATYTSSHRILGLTCRFAEERKDE